MAVVLIVELSCDHTGCDLAYLPDVDEMTSVLATRTGSRQAGWTRRDGRDYCPQHSPNDTAILVGLIRGLAARHQTDTQIANGLELTHEKVQRLRRKHGIPAGVRPGRPAGRTGVRL